MKKVKILLAVVTVVSAIGGALAFKANDFNSKVIYTKGAGAAGSCTVSITQHELGGSVDKTNASTQSLTTGCPLNFTRETAIN